MSRMAKLMAAAQERDREAPQEKPKGTIPEAVGNWSKMARDQMKADLLEVRDNLKSSVETQRKAILEGALPVEIDIDNIVDEVGSDRLLQATDGDDDEGGSFQALVANIRKRGLRTPLRVRPIDPDWQPNEEHPTSTGEQVFALQSGRRRLAACRELGLKPLAFISFSGDNAKQDDLQERFFENTTRKNLTLIEKLHSIGLIANDMPTASQEQVSELLGVNQSYVSRGKAVVKYFEQLQRDLDLRSVTSVEIDAALKKYRGEELSESPNARRKREERRRVRAADVSGLPFAKREVGEIKTSLKLNSKGERILAIRSADLPDEVIDKIMDLLASHQAG